MMNRFSMKRDPNMGLPALFWIILHLHLAIILGALIVKDSVDLWLRLSFFVPGVLMWVFSAWVRLKRYAENKATPRS